MTTYGSDPSPTPWNQLTSIRVGDGTTSLVKIDSKVMLRHLILNCAFSYKIIGSGTNLIGSDSIAPSTYTIQLVGDEFSAFTTTPSEIKCGASLMLPKLAHQLAQQGDETFAELSGIPGTIAGALIGNAGAHGKCIFDPLKSVEIMTSQGDIISLTPQEIPHHYRTATFPSNSIILSATFNRAKLTTPEIASHKIREYAHWRKTHQPQSASAGSIFKNPENFSAGYLIDKCGFKGCRFKSLEISSQHANFIVNHATASEKDFTKLIQIIRQIVYTQTQINLQMEPHWINKEKNMSTTPQKIKVTVVYGGDSSEREISIQSGTAVAKALRTAGFDVTEANITACELNDAILSADIVFPVLHGGFGENGEFQALLEKANIPFVGAGSTACQLIMNKIETKKQLDQHDIPTAPWVIFEKNNSNREFPQNMKLPVVVKAPTQGSSVGVSIVKTMAEWIPALELAFQYDDEALVESFITGKELTCGIIHGKPLPIIELQFCGEFYDFDAKYTYKNGATQYLCPPPDLSEEKQCEIQKYAVAFAKVCDAESLVRVDFIIDDTTGIPYVLEGNAIPGFTDCSLVPKAAKVSGLEFPQLCAQLITQSLLKFHEKTKG